MSERRVDVSTAPMDVAARETNRVLRNTYMLLGMTLAFSAVTATISMVLQLPTFMYLVFVLVGFGLLFVCLLYTSPSPRDRTRSRMPSSA